MAPAKHVRLYGRELTVAGDEWSDTYRHVPDGADLVDPVLTAFPRHVARDAVCLDVGAGIGIHTLALSVLATAGRVVSVEPSSCDFGHLERNVAANHLANVTACRAWPAVCEPAAPFLDPAVARVSSERGPAGPSDAPRTTVDRLVEELQLERVDVLRISLHGVELGVLDGATQTLQTWRPVVFVVFNAFAVALRHGTLPHVALARLRDTFPYCHVLHRESGALGALGTETEVSWFLYDNACHGPVDDLVCTFDPQSAPGYAPRPSPTAGELTTAVSQREHARREAAAVREVNDALRRQNDELTRALDRARADNEALRRTMSWRVTSPLREVRARVSRTRARPAAAEGQAGADGPAPPAAVPDAAPLPLPLPPVEMRQLVGTTAEASFDNPTGALVFPELAPEAYDTVLDFGCGCGRIARQLIQQRPRPRRYLGIDLHRGMIEWCRTNLAPAAPGFEFLHHDVANPSLNPGPDTPLVAPFPAEDSAFSLVIAWSVFTHLTEAQAPHYLAEVARVLRPGGMALTTWFLFDKAAFPMMQPFQNALYINPTDVTNAVIFDRDWLRSTAANAGLTIAGADRPRIRGYQWRLWLSPADGRVPEVAIPEDDAPLGSLPPPLMPARASEIGL